MFCHWFVLVYSYDSFLYRIKQFKLLQSVANPLFIQFILEAMKA